VYELASKTPLTGDDILNSFPQDVDIEGATVDVETVPKPNSNGDGVMMQNNEADEAEDVDDARIHEEIGNDVAMADPIITDDEASSKTNEEEEEQIESNDNENNDESTEEAIFSNLFDVNMQGDNEENKEDKSEEVKHNNNDESEPTSTDEQPENVNDAQENRSVSIEKPSEENRSVSTASESGDTTVRVNRIDKVSLEHEINKYNLRKRMKKTKDDNFNKQHYSYLNFITSTRGRNKCKKKIEKKLYEQEAKKEIVKVRRNQRYCRNKLHRSIVGTCMTQMSAQKGIKVYGRRALTAMAREYSQLDDLSVFRPHHRNELSKEQRESTLNVIDLIKEKRCGKIKGRTVVDGRGQRGNYEKNETSSSALTLEAFITTLAIDAAELRDVATADIAGAFLKADQPDLVTIKMRGPAVDAILEANKEKYESYVSYEHGKRVLYMELMKAMYGTLTAPILWYQLFAATLTDLGFTINAYDPCVANKMINGKQFTVCWYVDDLKLSHESSEVVSDMIKVIESKFGKMTVTRGKKHTYLGIDFEIKNEKVHINMKAYLQECIDSYGESIMCNATAPATKELMYVNEESQRLEEFRKDKFHHIVAKLLHISKRSRLDLQVSIGYLCTRVQHPTVEDWKKLRRVLQYIRGTIDMERIVSMKLIGEIDIFIDASHGAHWDKKGQTGGCVSVGSGVIHARSNKQNINTKSSTETELVGNSDYLTYPIWIIRFLEEQGCKMSKRTLHQDNESTIKLLKNGTKSCGKKSRHVDIRYFWTTDRIKELGINVIHCVTEKMLADFFTKPLQGSLFRNMRDVVQGLKEYDTLTSIKVSSEKEVKKEEKYMSNKKKKKIESSCRQERVGELPCREEKKVRFDGCVDLNEKWKYAKNVEKKRTYADIVKMNKMKDTEYVRKSILK